MTGFNHPTSPELLNIFGAGGHAREVAWLARAIWGDSLVIHHLVDEEAHLSPGQSRDLTKLAVHAEPGWFVAAVGDIALRRRAASELNNRGFPAATLVHPSAVLAPSAKIGEGSLIAAGSVIGTDVSIGAHAHVNVSCSISHDAELGDFATVSPGVHISGHVRVEPDAFIGTGASIINGAPGNPLVIGRGAVIAAGACVIRDVGANSTVAGVPAVRKR